MSKTVANRSQPFPIDPSSGIRPAEQRLREVPGPSAMDAANDDDVTIALMPDYTRLQLDSADMTHVKTPNPALLAMARGDHVKRPKRSTWFALGMVAGAFAMWLLIGDLRPAIDAAHTLTTHAAQLFDHAPPPAAPAAPAAATH